MLLEPKIISVNCTQILRDEWSFQSTSTFITSYWKADYYLMLLDFEPKIISVNCTQILRDD